MRASHTRASRRTVGIPWSRSHHCHVRVILAQVIVGEVCQAETFSFLSTCIRVEQICHELRVCHAIKDQLGITNSEELPYTFESMYCYS